MSLYPIFVSPSINPVQQLLQELKPTIVTIAEISAFDDQFYSGRVCHTVPEIQDLFERIVRDKDHLINELKAMTIAQLERTFPTFRKENKADKVQDSYRSLLKGPAFFTVGTSSMLSTMAWHEKDLVHELRGKLAKLTHEQLIIKFEHIKSEQQKKLAQYENELKALESPETLADFKIFLKKKSIFDLAPTQLQQFDLLACAESREIRDDEFSRKAMVSSLKVGTGLIYIETIHTRDKYPLFVVQLTSRVERSLYLEARERAHKLSGWYSSYSKDGAVPGFQFKDKQSAEAFIQLCQGGNSISIRDKLLAFEEEKSLTKSEKFIRSGQLRIDRGTASLNKPRKENTARRAGMAARAEELARQEIAQGNTLINLGRAVEQGGLNALRFIRDINQVELLLKKIDIARRRDIEKKYPDYQERLKHTDDPISESAFHFVEYPFYKISGDELNKIIASLASVRGAKRLQTSLKKVSITPDKAHLQFSISSLTAEEIMEKLEESKAYPYYWDTILEQHTVLERMCIKSSAELRQACRELQLLATPVEKASKVKEIQRSLVGQNVGIDFFPTASDLADRMVSIAGIEPSKSQDILEPQGGSGNIAEAIRRAGQEPDVCEISSSLRELLQEKKFNLVGWDFLDYKDKLYDAIIANPPFSEEIAHTKHAYSLLKPDGILVTILSEGAFLRNHKADMEFRVWLRELGAKIEKLPSNSFMDSSLLKTTRANARLAIIRK